MNGIERIAAERQRQVDSEGWTPEHDLEHKAGHLAAAAGCYVDAALGMLSSRNWTEVEGPIWAESYRLDDPDKADSYLSYIAEMLADPIKSWIGRNEDGTPRLPAHGAWPFDAPSWKPSEDPIKNLVRAGALIAAEIDRLLADVIPSCYAPEQEK